MLNCRCRRIDGRVVEGARLEIVCTSKAYREFESHSIRHFFYKDTLSRVFFVFKALVRFELTGREFDLQSAGRREYADGLPADKGGERSRANRALSAISFIKAPSFGCFFVPNKKP